MPPTQARTPALALLLCVALAPAASAQDQPAPDREPPAPIRPSRPSQEPTREPPAEPASIPGLETTDRRIKPPAMLREGSFVVRRRGSMVKLPSGEFALIFHKDARGVAERPMVLIPNQILQRMEHSVGDKPEESIYSVSGEVFAYRGVNYLLLTGAALESAPAPAQKPDPQPAPHEPPPAPTGSAEVQDLIRRLELQRERPRTIDPSLQQRPPAAAIAEPGTPGQLIPEGRTIIRRRGRMVRTGSGDWSFVFDAGTDGDAAHDRPLLLAPCLTLQAMEQSALRHGDAATLEVSGRILAHGGRNYLVPTLFQVVRVGDIQPRP